MLTGTGWGREERWGLVVGLVHNNVRAFSARNRAVRNG